MYVYVYVFFFFLEFCVGRRMQVKGTSRDEALDVMDVDFESERQYRWGSCCISVATLIFALDVFAAMVVVCRSSSVAGYATQYVFV